MISSSATLFVLAVLMVDHTDATVLSTWSKTSESDSMRLRLHEAEKEHTRALAALTSNMTLNSALEAFKERTATSPGLLKFLKATLEQRQKKARSSAQTTHLRAAGAVAGRPSGYSGVDKAKNMLNEMIEEVQKKYDLELQKCCEYDESQSALIEEARQDISLFNAEAAEARKEVLEAQAHITICEQKLPELSDALTKHNKDCHEEISNLHAQLEIVLADVAVMTTILGMTECDKNKLFLVSCADECTGKSFVSFHHDALQSKVSSLKSIGTRELLDQSLADAIGQMPLPAGINESNISFGPRSTQVQRQSPCKTAVPKDKRTGKCSMNSNPNCPKMQEKFMYIQAGIIDKRDELKEQISKLELDCKTIKENLESQISYFETQLKDQQTSLAAGTKKQNNAEEQSRLKTKELHELQRDYDAMTSTCHTNYGTLEGEECGLKKIRGELYKMQGQDNPAFFQDCIVGDWLADECSASCAGGIMRLDRSILTHPVGGSKCPLLVAQKPCNEQKCPIDCRLEDWEGWSGCTAKCGGGLRERSRMISVEPEHGGEQCGETAEAESCNMAACDKDCELADWTEWSVCSKQCDGGVNERMKSIVAPIVGDGFCPSMRSEKRMQEKTCNDFMCVKEDANELTLHCETAEDIILVIDGSASLGERGWAAVLESSGMLAQGLLGGRANVQLSVILYSDDVEIVQHFSNDTEGVLEKIADMQWPAKETYTSEALNNAASELSLGRPDAQSVVIVITDGKPMSMRKTRMAAKKLREQARVMWVPVTDFAPLGALRKWSSEPIDENFLPLKDFDDLKNPEYINKIIADVCPRVS